MSYRLSAIFLCLFTFSSVRFASAAVPDARAVQALASVNTDAAGLAIEDMARTWPDRFDAAGARAALKAFCDRRAELDAAVQRGDGKAAAEAMRLAGAVRAALLANPLLDPDRVVLLRREFPKPADARRAMGASLGVGSLNAHTSDTIQREGAYRDRIVVLSNLRGNVTESTVYTAPDGLTLIDPTLDFDAKRLLFARNGDRQKNWRIFEVGLDGSGLHQVTPDDGEDVGHFDPCWLSNGRMIFASSAVFQGLPCEFGGRQMVCLYLLDPPSGAIRQLTFEQDSDWCPVQLPNGRVMYLRWEYTDQSHSNSRILFHMNPDGTDQRELRGSGSWFPGSFFHAKPIPGDPRRIIGIATGHHGTPRSGRMLILDPSLGRHDAEGIVQEIPGRGKSVEPIVRDRLVDGVWPQFLMPWPLSANYHLVLGKLQAGDLWGLYLVDTFDNITLIHEVEGSALLWPALVQPRAKPPVIPDRVNLATNAADVAIADVYAGPGLADVPRGTVKNLRLIEYYFSRRGMGGLYGTLGADGPWDVKRILGTVPVEKDGSAHFTIPANSPVAIQPVDAQGAALQLMRSWFVAMPGERVSCVGCHENQSAAPVVRSSSAAAARAPDEIHPWYGPARGFSFVREVQPVLDRYCASCHDRNEPALTDGTRPGLPYLKGDLQLTNWNSQLAGQWRGGGRFTVSYFELQRYLRRPGIEGDRRMFTPMDYHFNTTELGQLLAKGHYGVKLDAESLDRITTWHDLNAPFFGTWGEIPGVKCSLVSNTNVRAMELRRNYVPSGPHPDYEAVPEQAAYDRTPVKPASADEPAQPPVAVDGWPFNAARAAEMQKASAPGGAIRSMLLELPGRHVFPATAQFVRVLAGPAKWLSIAEAEVMSGGRNVARGRPATQSSTQFGGDAARAVDGNRDGVYDHGSMTHTGSDANEWWEADLGSELAIDDVVLWNRTDIAGERLAGVTVQLLDAKRSVVAEVRTPPVVGESIALAKLQPASLELSWIPAGAFAMGSTNGHPDERPIRSTRIERGFWMARHEINNILFRQFQPAHESRTEDRHGYQFGRVGYDQDQPGQPAVRVSWNEASAFCAWLSQKTGRKVTLPTEAQWEWACRAGSAEAFSFGPLNADYARFANLGDRSLRDFAADTALDGYEAARPMKNPSRYDDWLPRDDRFDDGGFVTEPVGRYQPNAWGLCDMHGNAAEWTASDFPGAGGKVVRGGSWRDRPFRCTSSFRLAYPPHQRVFNVGFRVIVTD